MRIAVDIDGILTNEIEGYDYKSRTPNFFNIYKINSLYNHGHLIILYSARYQQDQKITKQWLKKYRVKYHRLVLGKLQYDILIDDKATSNFDTL